MKRLALPRLLLLCLLLSACIPAQQTTESEGRNPGDCTDNADNDGDGRFDCEDEGCAGAPSCNMGPDDMGATLPQPDMGVVTPVEPPEPIECMLDQDCPPEMGCDANTGYCVAGASTCNLATCQDDFAATCDGSLSMDCAQSGGTCGDFDGEDGPFSWCQCPQAQEGTGSCIDPSRGVVCQDGLLVPNPCPAGTLCDAGLCACDNVTDGVCPDEVCALDPDCDAGPPACAPGECGGMCGGCGLGQTCEGGQCRRPDVCVPDCDGRACGPDGCGGTCGACTAPDTCNMASGKCEGECVPTCAPEQTCGTDGCGGACGSPCAGGLECSRCPGGVSCAVDTFTCRCDFFSRVRYAFDASAYDFTDTNNIVVEWRHIALDGVKQPAKTVFLRASTTTGAGTQVGACEPDIEIRRVYSMRGGARCEFTDTVSGREDFVIPQGALDGNGSCTAPAL